MINYCLQYQFFFEKKGYPSIKWKQKCINLFINEKNLTISKPTKKALSNKFKGL